MVTRIAAYLVRRSGGRRCAEWPARRRILLRTAVARRVEVLIVTDLLDLPLDPGAAARDPDALAHAVQAAPQFREAIRAHGSVAAADALGARISAALAEYAGTRSAVAEMTTTLCEVIFGALAFQALTPGTMSMAPGVADAIARSTAIAAFPLGQMLGSLWYGMFPVDAARWLVEATVAGLIMLGSVFAAFAGILADPVQSRLGIHRRRLLRLLDTLVVDCLGLGERPFVAREHFIARMLDLWDALASAFRFFRS